MTIYLGADHNGFEMKNHLADILTAEDYDIVDCGPDSYDETDDYPDYVFPVAEQVAANEGNGIVLCGSGQGAAIASNKVVGVRAAVYYGEPGEDTDLVEKTRRHNDANVLALGADYLSEEEVEAVVTRWLETGFSEVERHTRRNEQIASYDSKQLT